MASPIEQLQGDIANPRMPVVSLLQKAIPRAKNQRDEKFIEWAKRELIGVAHEDADCIYRRLKGQYVVLTSDGRTLAIHWKGSPEDMNSRFITLPLAEVESLISGEGQTFLVKINVDPRSLSGIDLEPGDTIGFSVSRATVLGLLNAVRQRVLDWTLNFTQADGRGSGSMSQLGL